MEDMKHWQPIETAPKDGTRVLIYDAHAGMVVMFFMDGKFRDVVSLMTMRHEASHWMPLPADPLDT